MSLGIRSEIGRLRAVMVHLPGEEVDGMLPSMMEDLLFDDILFGERAREEHRRFQNILEYVADEVIELQDLLADVLDDDGARSSILDGLRAQSQVEPAAWEILDAASPRDLSRHLIAGLVRPGVEELPENPRDLYLLPPIPNLFFQRDPAVVFGDNVVVASMATEARMREPLLVSHVFRHHPRFGGGAEGAPFLLSPFAENGASRSRPFMFEGGDILVARDDLLIIGVSVRTGRHTVERFAESLRQIGSSIKKIIVVDLPKARSFMHLDTVFTIISEGECLIYEPAVLPGEIEEVDVYQVDLGNREFSYTAKKSLLGALAASGMDLRPIPCGGPDDPIAQQREQWTDGANAFALAPGVILCYERNVKTSAELARNGYEIIHENDLLLGKTEMDLETSGKKYAIQIQGNELSRARGGPRCMTCPLLRDDL